MIKIANHCHYHKKYARELVERIKGYDSDEEFLIQIEDDSLALCCQIQNQKTCFNHSLTDPKWLKRASQRNQLLLKACNNKKREIHSVIDLTAGWGRDSFILATHGQHVTMIEQNSLIFNCLNFLLNTWLYWHEHQSHLNHCRKWYYAQSWQRQTRAQRNS